MSGPLPPLPPFGFRSVWQVLSAVPSGPWTVVTLIGELGALAWYWRRVQVLAARGRRWPVRRSVAFVGGIAMTALAWQTGIVTYAGQIFTVHIFQHLALMLAAPILFALSAPVTLVMQTSTRPTKVRLLRILRSRPVHMATNPLFTGLMNYGIMFWFFMDRGIVVSMAHPALMDTVNTAFLFFGCLLWWPVVSVDFVGRRPYAPPIRALIGIAGMPFDSVLAVSLITGGTTVSIAPGMYSAANVATGAEVFWIMAMVLTGLGVAVPSRRFITREQLRNDREDERVTAASAAGAAAATVRSVSSRGWWDAETTLDADGLLQVPWAREVSAPEVPAAPATWQP
jgi:cytochrome c oxidase assembly factor CtaG